MDNPTEENLASQLGLTRPQLTYRLESANQHFAYFSLAANGRNFELDPHLDCVLTLVSRAAVRHFSRQLFGFESSSPDHVYENFLSGLSEIRRVGERTVVEESRNASGKVGMRTMNQSLYELYKAGHVTYEIALQYSGDPEDLKKTFQRG